MRHTIETTEITSVGHCQSKIVYRTSVVVYEQNSKRFLFEQIFLEKDCVVDDSNFKRVVRFSKSDTQRLNLAKELKSKSFDLKNRIT